MGGAQLCPDPHFANPGAARWAIWAIKETIPVWTGSVTHRLAAVRFRRHLSLIGFRALQAVGGALTQALGFAIITEVFPAQQRGRALGFLAASWGSGSLLVRLWAG